jgi:hypothetical protein
MLQFQKTFDFYIKSSLHVALAILAFLKVSQFSLNIPSNLILESSVFFGSVIGYNFLKYYGLNWKDKLFVYQNIGILIVTFLSIIGYAICFLKLNTIVQLAFLKIAVLVLCYPFLRKYWYLKSALVSFCVTFVVSYIPTLEVSIDELEVLVFQLKLFFLIGALMIPFEIYDSQFDALTLQTIPQKFGIRKAKIAGYVFLGIFVLLNSFFKFNLIYFIVAISVAFLICFSSTENSKYYTSFWVESVPIVWWILLLL